MANDERCVPNAQAIPTASIMSAKIGCRIPRSQPKATIPHRQTKAKTRTPYQLVIVAFHRFQEPEFPLIQFCLQGIASQRCQ